jgi:hypothetical protein
MSNRSVIIVCASCSAVAAILASLLTAAMFGGAGGAGQPTNLAPVAQNSGYNTPPEVSRQATPPSEPITKGPKTQETRKSRDNRALAKVEVRDGKIVSVRPVTPEELARSEEDAEAELTGPQPPGGLFVTCNPTKKSFANNESPTVELTFTNKGKDAISVALGSEAGGLLQPGGPIQVLLLTEAEGRVKKLKPRIDVAPSRWLDLAPSEKANATLSLSEWYSELDLSPGEYVLVVSLQSAREDAEALQLAKPPAGIKWWGSMQSGGPKFVVRNKEDSTGTF